MGEGGPGDEAPGNCSRSGRAIRRRHRSGSRACKCVALGSYCFIAAMRRAISSMLTSSLWVERCQLWPKGSFRVPERSP
jgi:hypothetical protein